MQRVIGRLLDEAEFLSPHGVRSLSRHHLSEPFTLHVGGFEATVGYEPGESQSGAFGGNSNWRGPVWLPANILIIQALRRFARFYGEDIQVELPTRSGQLIGLSGAADEISRRLVTLLTLDEKGRRPSHGDVALMQEDPRWRDLIAFHEYFHADTGAGLGASHQTGWTALVAELLIHRDDERQ